MQLFIVFVIISLAIAYAAYRIYKTLTSSDSRCGGCPLGDVCKNKHKN